MTLSMNNPTQNLEEAATIASEFIYSIDNLPNEVQFLLSEIRVKDTRAQEIQQEIDRESARYVQHALRPGTSGSAASLSSAFGSSSPSHSTTPSTANSAAPSSPTSASRSGSPRSAASPAGIAASYAEIQQLCDEKCALAQRLIELINRTRAKLDHDLARVRVLQGEPVDYVGASESLKNTLRASPSPASIDASTSGGPGSATKRRRLAPSASIKISTPTRRRSSSPATTVSTTTHTHQRSRLSRQVLPPEESEEEAEADENAGDNTEDMEDVDAEDDDKIYCFCRKKSFGDMIACDNEGNCPYEWFHLSCVGLKQPPPETWYCSVCSTSMTKSTSGSTRKGRKK